MENNAFKGTLFGGFNRQDVIDYIEKASRESAALLEENQERIAQLEKSVEELTAQRAALQTELQERTNTCEETERMLRETRSAHAAASEALESEQARTRQYAAEQARLESAVQALQKEVDEYHTLKNNIAEVELEAKHRAETIVAEAQKNAGDMMNKARSDAETLTQDAKRRAESTLQQANAAAAAVRQKADRHALLVRQQLSAQLAGCQEQYHCLLESYKGSALQAASALQKAQENVARLPQVFDQISEGLHQLGEMAQKKD